MSGNGYPVSAISVSALLVPHWMNLLSLSLLTGTRSRHLLNLFQSSLTCRDLEPVISYFLSRHYISCLHFLSVSSSVRNLIESHYFFNLLKVKVLLGRYLYSLLSNFNVCDNILVESLSFSRWNNASSKFKLNIYYNGR